MSGNVHADEAGKAVTVSAQVPKPEGGRDQGLGLSEESVGKWLEQNLHL